MHPVDRDGTGPTMYETGFDRAELGLAGDGKLWLPQWRPLDDDGARRLVSELTYEGTTWQFWATFEDPDDRTSSRTWWLAPLDDLASAEQLPAPGNSSGMFAMDLAGATVVARGGLDAILALGQLAAPQTRPSTADPRPPWTVRDRGLRRRPVGAARGGPVSARPPAGELAAPAPPAAVLAAGLEWLYSTGQPDGAVLQHHGTTLQGGDRYYQFCPQSAFQRPVVVVHVAAPEWSEGVRDRVLLNPLAPNELADLAAAVELLGFEVATAWNGHPGPDGSIGLRRPAHPSLLAALARYRTGCPEHPREGVFCSCGWYAAGNKLLVTPATRA